MSLSEGLANHSGALGLYVFSCLSGVGNSSDGQAAGVVINEGDKYWLIKGKMNSQNKLPMLNFPPSAWKGECGKLILTIPFFSLSPSIC